MTKITIHDPTLRDGNHAAKHQISLEQIRTYVSKADRCGMDCIEVGHGLGLGASSLQLGFSKHSDEDIIKTSRENIQNTKLGVHITPGYGKIKDLSIAFDYGVENYRVATHCTEANISETLITEIAKRGLLAFGCLTMSHMAPAELLLLEAKKMISYGAKGVILMDSAGAYTPNDVQQKIKILSTNTSATIGFHAHNNLGLAVANSIAAIQSGATIIDATICGYGAGAGNTPSDALAATMIKMGIDTDIQLEPLLTLSQQAGDFLMDSRPEISLTSICGGIYGTFCGYDQLILRLANKLKLNPIVIYKALGKRKLVAGQEDLVIDTAYKLATNKEESHAIS